MSFLDDTMYAIVRKDCNRRNGYGHLNANVLNIVKSWQERPTFRITAQCGSTHDISAKPDRRFYAEKAGIECDYDPMRLNSLEQAVKYMRKIDRAVTRMYEQFGEPVDYAEFMARNLIASGAEYVVFIASDDGSYHGNLEEQFTLDISDRKNHGLLRENLRRMQEHVLDRICGVKEAA